MKKKLMVALLTAMTLGLAACGQTEPGMEAANDAIQQLVQTGSLKDYSDYVKSLGQYAGLEISVPDSVVTDQDLEDFKTQVVQFYNQYYNNGEEVATWGDDVARAVSGGAYENAEDYEKYLQETLEQQAQTEKEQAFLEGIWARILEESDLGELPEEEVAASAESYYETQKDLYTYYATYYSYDYETYLAEKLGMTDEEFKEYCKELARTEKEQVYVASEIFKEQNMTLDDAAFSAGVAELVDQFGYASDEEFLEKYGEDYVREYLMHKMVNEFLLENNSMIVED